MSPPAIRNSKNYTLAAALLAVACGDDGMGFTGASTIGPTSASYGPTSASSPSTSPSGTNPTTDTDTDTDATAGTGLTTTDPTTGPTTGPTTTDPTTGPTTADPTTDTSGVPEECGDGVLDAGEECDDGNGTNTDACTNACKHAFCGDGIVGPGEVCDDGNNVDDDTCTNSCAYPGCGDGVVQDGEDCDDGNNTNTDACTNACNAAVCGDGIVRAGVETCDDGNNLNTDACTNACKTAVCGDGYIRAGVETCDDGNKVSNDGCSATCQTEGGQKYTAVGPQLNVPAASLTGWTVCYSDSYGDLGTPMTTILAQCSKANLMLACRPTGAATYTLLAHAPRTSVITDIGESNTPTIANGSGWYYSPLWSWGFARQGDTIVRSSCDTETVNGTQRLCWHTEANAIQGGFRCGSTDYLNESFAWERVVLHAD